MQHLRQRLFKSALLAGLILPLAACSIAPATAVVPTTAPTTAASIAASANLNLAAAPTTAPTAQRIAAPPAVPRSLSGTGEVRAVRTADLAFLVAGQVAELRVREGDTVTAGQVLAVLDLRPFDQQIRQAEAAMAGAEAALVGLSDPPRAADRRALEAQVRQAEVALEQARAGQGQDTRAAASGVASAQVALQQTRDQLSAAKSNAQLQMEQAANALRNAQDAYSRLYWDNRDLERLPGDLPQALIDAEAAALRAVQDGESALAQAQLALEQAQQQERTGVQAAEEQLRQALVAQERATLPAGADQVALAQARLDAARAQLAQLNPDPRPSQRVSAAAGVEQAQVALAQAQLNREFAELRAPFAGTVRRLNLELGEMATPGMPVLALLDLSALRFEVAVADVDIGRVALGQAARVQLDALEGAELTGTVSYVAPSSERQGNVQTFLVRVELPNDPRLRTGMSGRLFIE